VPSVKTEYGVCGLLPVELLDQRATCYGSGVRFEWTTATERNCAGFLVERSLDAADWITLSTVSCAGNSQMPLQYAYYDPISVQLPLYYRLMQFDTDGTVERLPVVVAQPCGRSRSSVHAWPSPVTDVLNLDLAGISGQLEGGMTIHLFDATGRLVHERSYTDEATVRIDMGGLAPGAYAVVVSSMEGAIVGRTRVVKE